MTPYSRQVRFNISSLRSLCFTAPGRYYSSSALSALRPIAVIHSKTPFYCLNSKRALIVAVPPFLEIIPSRSGSSFTRIQCFINGSGRNALTIRAFLSETIFQIFPYLFSPTRDSLQTSDLYSSLLRVCLLELILEYSHKNVNLFYF